MEFVNLDTLVWFQEGPGVRNYQYVDNGIKLINVTNLVNGRLKLHLTSRYISIYRLVEQSQQISFVVQ